MTITSPVDWRSVRHTYETDPEINSLKDVAVRFGVALEIVRDRFQAESWKRKPETVPARRRPNGNRDQRDIEFLNWVAERRQQLRDQSSLIEAVIKKVTDPNEDQEGLEVTVKNLKGAQAALGLHYDNMRKLIELSTEHRQAHSIDKLPDSVFDLALRVSGRMATAPVPEVEVVEEDEGN